MKLLITTALAAFAAFAATGSAALGAPQPYAGTLSIVADFDAVEGYAQVTGRAAYAIFGIVAYRTRGEALDERTRRFTGQDVVCYEHGAIGTDPRRWTYVCEFKVSDGGVIARPPA